MNEEQLSGPTVDEVFIKKLMSCISDCHYSANRRPPFEAVQQIRIAITEMKRDPEWSRHFKRAGP
jgi:hypothetical protein